MRLAFISDVHFGKNQEDMKAWNFALSLLEFIGPDEIFLGGDIYDHESVGRYRKKPEAITSLQAEISHGFDELAKLRSACPTAHIYFYRGNHERRLDNFLLDFAQPLVGLQALCPSRLYRLAELDIEIVERGPVKKGHLWLAHGDEFSTGSTNPAARALDDLNSNILFGHVHRVSTASKQQLNKRSIVAWSNSCLCRLDPHFVLNPDWTQGFTIVDFTESGYFSVTPVTFWTDPKRKCLATMIGGEYFESRKSRV